MSYSNSPRPGNDIWRKIQDIEDEINNLEQNNQVHNYIMQKAYFIHKTVYRYVLCLRRPIKIGKTRRILIIAYLLSRMKSMSQSSAIRQSDLALASPIDLYTLLLCFITLEYDLRNSLHIVTLRNSLKHTDFVEITQHCLKERHQTLCLVLQKRRTSTQNSITELDCRSFDSMLLVSPLESVWFLNCLTWSHCGNSFRSLSFCFRSHYSKALCSSVARFVIELGSCGTKSGNLCFNVCGVFVFPILSGRFMVCHILTLII